MAALVVLQPNTTLLLAPAAKPENARDPIVCAVARSVRASVKDSAALPALLTVTPTLVEMPGGTRELTATAFTATSWTVPIRAMPLVRTLLATLVSPLSAGTWACST